MNRKQILEALDEISDSHIKNAAIPPKRKVKKVYWYSGIAAMLAIAILLGVFLGPQTAPPSQIEDPTAPTYPQVPTFTPSGPRLVSLSGQTIAGVEYPARHIDEDVSQHLAGLNYYFTRTMEQFLQGDENAVFSPMNLYMALTVLAECTDGDTRAEILALLGSPNADVLRWQANALWNSAYQLGVGPCTLANSVWLQEGMTYNKDTMDLLAEKYYASVFGHDFTAPNAAEPIAQWINKETGGLLQEQTGELEFDPNTVLALVSTIYMQAEWGDGSFEEEKNTEGVFNGTHGQTTCTYMNTSKDNSPYTYYWGEDYGAVALEVEGNYTMWLILPEEGKTTEDVLHSGAYTNLFLGGSQNSKNSKQVKVNLSLPKFDISCKQDMIEGLRELGINKVFDEQADFSPAFPDSTGIYVNKAEQATRVTVDEKGITAASYVVISAPKWSFLGDEEIDFVLDRPFLFVLTNSDGQALFAGCVNNL